MVCTFVCCSAAAVPLSHCAVTPFLSAFSFISGEGLCFLPTACCFPAGSQHSSPCTSLTFFVTSSCAPSGKKEAFVPDYFYYFL